MRTGVVALIGILAVIGLPAAAQEVGEDDLTDELARIGLKAPPGLRKAKRRQAKEEGWSLTGVAAAAAGYDSNIYLGPNNTTDSAVFDIGGNLDGLFYFTRDDRLEVTAQSANTPYTASSRANEFTQKLRVRHGAEAGPRDDGGVIAGGG